ncbi:hypothetical protein HDU86_004788 [Geranomyces michiganensis]|nr:hypothetical protein HDU86_004788 [Geranomyces michiganensis]
MATIRGATGSAASSPSATAAATTSPPNANPAKPAAAATTAVAGPRNPSKPLSHAGSYPKLSDEPLRNWFADSALHSDNTKNDFSGDDGEQGYNGRRKSAGPRQPTGAFARLLADLKLETRKAHAIVLGLVCLDFLISLAALFEAIYDTALPPALSPSLTITKTLHTTSAGFTAVRIFLFTTSLLLRIAFLLEIALRIYIHTTQTSRAASFFTSPSRTTDAVGFLLLFILHIALPAREALICNTLVLARVGRQAFLLAGRRELWSQTQSARELAARKRQWDGEMSRLLDKNRALQKMLTEQGNKMKVFTGELDIMDADLSTSSMMSPSLSRYV